MLVHCSMAFAVGYYFAQRRDLNMRMLFEHSREDPDELPYINMADFKSCCSILS